MEWEFPHIEHGVPTKYNWVVLHPEMLELGKDTDIGAFTLIQAKYCVVIRDYVQIGAGVKIYSHNTIDGTYGPVIIGEGACIGANSVILPNTYIGPGVKVGALSLVKDDIRLLGTYAGNPLRRLK